ncbi:MAG: hypothetical protein ACRDEB_08080 [Chitinophagaceae bacterium]
MKYPSHWIIDDSDEDFDIDSFLDIKLPDDRGFIMFFLFDTSIDETEHVESQIKAHLSKSIKKGLVTRFNKWGSFTGTGAKIEGKLTGIFKGEIFIFAHSTDSTSFLTVYLLYDRNREVDLPGFKLIERTFHLK